MAINKVIYGGETLIDLTGDTVTADKILSGFTAHDKAGEPITGTCEFDEILKMQQQLLPKSFRGRPRM